MLAALRAGERAAGAGIPGALAVGVSAAALFEAEPCFHFTDAYAAPPRKTATTTSCTSRVDPPPGGAFFETRSGRAARARALATITPHAGHSEALPTFAPQRGHAVSAMPHSERALRETESVGIRSSFHAQAMRVASAISSWGWW